VVLVSGFKSADHDRGLLSADLFIHHARHYFGDGGVEIAASARTAVDVCYLACTRAGTQVVVAEVAAAHGGRSAGAAVGVDEFAGGKSGHRMGYPPLPCWGIFVKNEQLALGLPSKFSGMRGLRLKS